MPPQRSSPGAASMVLGALVVVALVGGVLWYLRRDERTTVVLVGDSIAQETAPYLEPLLHGDHLVAKFFGGTAPCDWLNKDLGVGDGDAVVISFTGNSETPCMRDASGAQIHGQALLDRYREDLTTIVDEVAAKGAPVLLVGQPQRGPNAPDGETAVKEVAGINQIFEDLAGAHDDDDITFVDAGAAVEKDDGSFAATLPCLPGEDSCGADGQNPVRSDDGVHLCPGLHRQPCPVYSSGAHRFAAAIADALGDG